MLFFIVEGQHLLFKEMFSLIDCISKGIIMES